MRREDLHLEALEYRSSEGREIFLQYVDQSDRLAAFLRLSLPEQRPSIGCGIKWKPGNEPSYQ